MQHRDMRLSQALRQINSVRNVSPNSGFINELVLLEIDLTNLTLLSLFSCLGMSYLSAVEDAKWGKNKIEVARLIMHSNVRKLFP